MNQDLTLQTNIAILSKDTQLANRIIIQLKAEGNFDLSNMDIVKLQYVRIQSLSPDQLLEVMKASILIVYTIESFSWLEAIKEYSVEYNFMPGFIDLCKKIILELDKNKELLGNKNIVLADKQVQPTIAYWIEDYITSLGIRKADALGIIQYLNTSKNVKLLSPEQRLMLKDIIEMHDYCANEIALWDIIPDDVDINNVEAMMPGFSSLDMIPGYLHEDGLTDAPNFTENQSKDIQQPSVKLPALEITRPTPSATLPIQPLSMYPPKPKLDAVQSSVAPVAKPAMKVPAQSAANPGLIHDIINKKPKQRMGVVMDPTNVKLEEEQKRLEQNRHAEANAIQSKLAELRKRNKTE